MTDQEILRDNIAQIEGLDPESYPTLYRLLFRGNSSLHAHLLHILTYMQTHRIPFETDQNGRGYWKIPVAYLVREHGGTVESWQSHIIFLLDAGLLSRIRPDQRSVLPRLREEWQRALERGQRAAACYRVVCYTDERLAQAEEVAARYVQAGIGISHLTKTDVIRASGQQRADELYRTGDQIADPERWVLARIKEKILADIEGNGYARWDDIYSVVQREIIPDPFVGCDDEEESRMRALEKIDKRKKAVCRLAECEFHPPRREDRERFELEDHGWIITKLPETNS